MKRIDPLDGDLGTKGHTYDQLVDGRLKVENLDAVLIAMRS